MKDWNDSPLQGMISYACAVAHFSVGHMYTTILYNFIKKKKHFLVHFECSDILLGCSVVSLSKCVL